MQPCISLTLSYGHCTVRVTVLLAMPSWVIGAAGSLAADSARLRGIPC